MSKTEAVAGVVLKLATGLVKALPDRWKRALDDRFFGAIFQVTRVTNDAYGWKPPADAPDTPPAP